MWTKTHKKLIGRKSEKYFIIQSIMNCFPTFNFSMVTFFTAIKTVRNQYINRECKNWFRFHNNVSVSMKILSSFFAMLSFDFVEFLEG